MKYSVVIDGDEVVQGLNHDHAKGVANGLRIEKPDSMISVVPFDPNDPNDGPAALKALFPL